MTLRVYLLLFIFLTSLYLTTSAGHFASGDEDAAYALLVELVELGRFGAAGTGTSYGVVQPLLAIPFYLVGKGLAGWAPVEFSGAIGRFAVTWLSAVVSAASAVGLAHLARLLGASTRTGVTLAVIYGLGTLAWAYARNFWTEPISALLLVAACILAVQSRSGRPVMCWLGVGLLVGLSAGVRAVGALHLPAFGLYLLLAGVRAWRETGSPSWMARGLSGLAMGIGAPLVALMVLNVVRYGHPFDTGHGLSEDPLQALRLLLHGNPLEGLYGLTVSPGKGLLFYSPIFAASIVAFSSFLRKHREEALLFAALMLLFVGFHAPVPFWAGDDAWGPRYLVRLLPLVVLPLMVWFEDQWTARRRWLVVSTVAAGIAVQFLPVVVNYKIYTAETADASGSGARWFNPADSPILGHARLLLARVQQYGPSPMATPPYPVQQSAGEFVLGPGFWGSRYVDSPYPRYTDGHATIYFAISQAAALDVWLDFERVVDAPNAARPGIQLELDDRAVDGGDWRVVTTGGRHRVLARLGDVAPGQHRLEILSPWLAHTGRVTSSKGARLGIQVHDFALFQDGLPFSFKREPQVLPLPVSTVQPWGERAFGWFNDGRTPHLVDWWPWYVARSGLPPWLAATVIVPLAVTMLTAWRLWGRVAQPGDLLPCAVTGGLAVCLFGGILLVAAVVRPTAVRGFSVKPPASPPGTWAIHPYEARTERLPGTEPLLVEVPYVDSGRSPVIVHYRTGAGREWTHVAWLLPRNATQAWRSATLAVPAGQDDERELAFASAEPAILKPLEITPTSDGAALARTRPVETALPGSYGVRDGFYAPEGERPFPRWTSGRATLELHPLRSGQLTLHMHMVQPETDGPRPVPDLDLLVDGREVPESDRQMVRTGPGRYALDVRARELQAGRPTLLQIISPVFVPALLEPGSADQRHLGVQIESMVIAVEGHPLTHVELPHAGAATSALRDPSQPPGALWPGEYRLAEGFYESEDPGKPFPRWTDGRGVLEVYPRSAGPLLVDLEVRQPGQDWQPAPPALSAYLDGRAVPAQAIRATPRGSTHYILQLELDSMPERPRPVRLELLSPTFVPTERELGSTDQRRLGILIERLSVHAGGESLVRFRSPALGLLGVQSSR